MDNNLFQSEISALDESIKEIEDLYQETKSHFDRIKSNNARSTLSFIHLQTSNLISLKNAKVTMLKEKATLKKSLQDLILKENKDNNDTQKDNAMINELYKKLVHEENLNTETDDLEDNENNEDIDNLLEERYKQIKKTKKKSSYETAVLRKGKSWKFIKLNSKGKRVKAKDGELPEKNKYKMKFIKNDGEMVAIDQNEKIYKLIEKQV